MTPDTIVLSRDCDSRLSARERRIVDDWILSDKRLLVIRDHINHYDFPILAGMWGLKGGLSENSIMQEWQYSKNHQYLMDQFWLRDIVWPELQMDSLICGIKETMWMRQSYPDIGREFIGQTYDENCYGIYEGKLV